MLLGDPAAPEPVRLSLEDLPSDVGELGDVSLGSVGDLQNVNCIATGEVLEFGPQLNVVFGSNGAGKSGYTRLLRRVCRAAHPGEVLRDVFDPGAQDKPQTASITVSSSGRKTELSVDLAERPDRLLSSIAVFDSGCADYSLTRSTVIEWAPRPLRVLRALAAAQEELAEDLKSHVDGLRDSLPEIDLTTTETVAAHMVRSLTHTSDLADLERLAELTSEELADLDSLERTVSLGEENRRSLIQAARSRSEAVSTLVEQLRTFAPRLSDKRLSLLASSVQELGSAKEAEELLVENAFRAAPVRGSGSDPWRQLWEAAAAFAAHDPQSMFPPNAGDACLLCQQDVSESAAERMGHFADFIRERQRGRVATAERTVTEWFVGLPTRDRLLAEVDPLLSVIPEGSPKDEALSALGATLSRLETATAISEGVEATIPKWAGDLRPLEQMGDAASQEESRLTALGTESTREKERRRLTELQGRRELSTQISQLRQRHGSLRELATYEGAAKGLVSTSITNLLTKLSGEVINEALRRAVQTELEGLNPIAGKVKVAPRQSKGQTTVTLRLGDQRTGLRDVLSEGEQRALALAFFLAEATVREDACAMVLDDPVSSLDHDRRRWVARRLVREAQRRQVIVFTHDIAFLHFLEEAAERANPAIPIHGQRVHRWQGRVGVVSTDLPSESAAPGRRRKELKERLRRRLERLYADSDPSYSREVERWLLELRRGYEYVIEELVLRGVVRRKSLKVQQSKLRNVKPDPELVHRILLGMRDSSEDAHYEPPELQAPPLTPVELRALLGEFEEVCAQAGGTEPRQDKQGTVDAGSRLHVVESADTPTSESTDAA